MEKVISVTDPAAGSVTIRDPHGFIAGKVLTGDACNATPVVGATVKLVHGIGETLTDSQGRFAFEAPVGKAWVEIDKPGYLAVQRYAFVREGQDTALPTVFLAAQDPNVTHIVASQGGTVTDSSGDAQLTLPPGSLPADADIVLTVVRQQRALKGPPLANFIPGASVRIKPEQTQLNVPATVKIRNVHNLPQLAILAYDWDMANQVWLRTLSSNMSPDGVWLQATIDHFSGLLTGCGQVVDPDPIHEDDGGSGVETGGGDNPINGDVPCKGADGCGYG